MGNMNDERMDLLQKHTEDIKHSVHWIERLTDLAKNNSSTQIKDDQLEYAMQTILIVETSLNSTVKDLKEGREIAFDFPTERAIVRDYRRKLRAWMRTGEVPEDAEEMIERGKG